MKNPFQGKNFNWTLCWHSILFIIILSFAAWKINRQVAVFEKIEWSKYFTLKGVLIVLASVLIILIVVWGVRKFFSSKNNNEPPKDTPSKPDTVKKKVSFNPLPIVKILLYIAGILFLYYCWKEWEDHKREQKEYARTHPSVVADTILLTREWSNWIYPDQLSKAPHRTNVRWDMIGESSLKLMDAKHRVVSYGSRERKSFNPHLSLDSLRFKVVDSDSALLVLVLTRIE